MIAWLRELLAPIGPWAFPVVAALSLFGMGAGFAILGGWAERKIIARTHSRRGPMYTGPAGILQTAADALKFLTKEVIFPTGSDGLLFRLAPIMLLLSGFVALAFLPLGGEAIIPAEHSLVIVLALLSITPIGILLASAASNSKYATLGGLRAAGMTMSYEAVVALAAASVAISAGSTDLIAIGAWQSTHVWFVLAQPLAFVLFLIGITASVERNPFDLVEAESELVSGWRTEYGGAYFSLTLLAEYIKLLGCGILCAMLFLGGTSGGVLLFWCKVLVFVLGMFVVRATAMRLRLDQVFRSVWERLVPLGMLNIVLTLLVRWW